MKTATTTQIDGLFDKYLAKGGTVTTLREGVLGYGTVVCYGEKLKTCIINEFFINEWSSGHSVRFYNKMPAKYLKMLDEL